MDHSQDWIRDGLARYGLLRISGGAPADDEGGDGDGDGDGDGGAGGDGKGGGDKKGGAAGDGKDGKGGGDAGGWTAPKDQAEFDRMVQDRLRRQEEALKTSIRSELKAEADLAAAAEQGNFKALYEAEKQKAENLAAEAKAREYEALRASIAAKHNIPADLATRLQGENEAALEEDAKKMAKFIKTQSAADTEAGSRRRSKTKTDGESGYQYGSGQAQVPWPAGVKTTEG